MTTKLRKSALAVIHACPSLCPKAPEKGFLAQSFSAIWLLERNVCQGMLLYADDLLLYVFNLVQSFPAVLDHFRKLSG